LRWLQKQHDDDEDKSQPAAAREFQAAGTDSKLKLVALSVSWLIDKNDPYVS